MWLPAATHVLVVVVSVLDCVEPSEYVFVVTTVTTFVVPPGPVDVLVEVLVEVLASLRFFFFVFALHWVPNLFFCSNIGCCMFECEASAKRSKI